MFPHSNVKYKDPLYNYDKNDLSYYKCTTNLCASININDQYR